jgi:glucosamine--fructose-6-phosphate aminotransferase (isomerizing)
MKSIFFETIAVQLLSYFAALKKDVNPDFPRNLAKSVTVK